MATQVQFRRGTTTQNNAFTGAIGEITYDTEIKTLRLHDGSNAGGGAVVVNTASAQTLTNKTLSTGSIWNGTAVALGYGGTGAALTAVAGAVAYSTGSALALSSAGTSGQVLTSGGSSAPTWVNAASITAGSSTNATYATNIAGGSAGQLVIQQDTDLTTFITAGASGTFLRSEGAGYAPSWATADVTIGSTTISLGGTSATLAGVTSIGITGTTDASSITTGVLTVAGGVGISKKLYVGTDASVAGNLTVTGDLTINGTTTTVNSTTLTVDDKNIELGSVASPSNITADGGGITLKGTTDKTLNWVSSTGAWTSSEDFNLLTGKTYEINGTVVLSSTALGTGVTGSSLTSVGTIGTGVWQGTIVAGQYGGTGVNNSGKTITLGGNLTTSGAYATTLTATATTSVTLPTTGTLATLAGAETLTNKTIAAGSNTISGLTNSNLSGSAGITNANLANSTISGVALGSNLGTLTISTGLTGTSYNGSTGVTIALATSGVTAGSYTTANITVDAYGRVTSASSGQGGATISDDTTTSATYYPLISTGISGTLTAVKVSSSKLTFNPSSGTLTATVLSASSDARLKTDIKTIDSALDKVLALRGVEFTRIDGGAKEIGVIAQEIEQIIPQVVSDSMGYKSVAYGNVVGLLIEAIKDQQKQIEELKAKLGN